MNELLIVSSKAITFPFHQEMHVDWAPILRLPAHL